MQKSSHTFLRDTSSQINAYCCNQQSIHFFKAYIHLMSDDACFIKTRCRNKFLTQKEVKYVIIVVMLYKLQCIVITVIRKEFIKWI